MKVCKPVRTVSCARKPARSFVATVKAEAAPRSRKPREASPRHSNAEAEAGRRRPCSCSIRVRGSRNPERVNTNATASSTTTTAANLMTRRLFMRVRMPPNNQYATRVAIVPIYEQYFECITIAQFVSRFQSALDANYCPAHCWSTMGDRFCSAKAASKLRDGVMPNPNDATVKRARPTPEHPRLTDGQIGPLTTLARPLSESRQSIVMCCRGSCRAPTSKSWGTCPRERFTR
ncbi:MAG: hypothetical protein JWR69_649 [Pedosphaera sp.]|nr:hypothetical protein [Pedosphaera sp.]